MEDRITLTDTLTTAIVKLAEGNPGAAVALMEMGAKVSVIDPMNAFGNLSPLLSCDTERIYGPRIWMLFKDVCGHDAVKALGLMRGVQLGIISSATLSYAIDNNGDGLDVDDVLAKVRKELPSFQAAALPEVPI